MDRRDFLKSTAVVAAAASGAGEWLKAAERTQAMMPEEGTGNLIASPPMLQNYAETSIGVTFAVNALANGYVLIGEKPAPCKRAVSRPFLVPRLSNSAKTISALCSTGS